MADNKSVDYAFKGNEEILEHYRKDGYTNEQLMGVATVYNKLNSFDDRCISKEYTGERMSYLARGFKYDLDLNNLIDMGYTYDALDEIITFKKLYGADLTKYLNQLYNLKQLQVLGGVILSGLPVKKYFKAENLIVTLINVLQDAYGIPMEELKDETVDSLILICNKIQTKANREGRRDKRLDRFYKNLNENYLPTFRAAKDILNVAIRFAEEDLYKFVTPIESDSEMAIYLLVTDNVFGNLVYYHAVKTIVLTIDDTLKSGDTESVVKYLEELYPGLVSRRLILHKLDSDGCSSANMLLQFVYNLYDHETILNLDVKNEVKEWFINCKLAYNGEPFRIFLKSLIKNEFLKRLQ